MTAPTRRPICRCGLGGLAVLLSVTIAGAAIGAPSRLAAGKPLYDKYCAGCHDIGLGAENGEGPKLNGVIGRPAGTIRGFHYSTANRRSAVVWTIENLQNFIADPLASMPGTRMEVPGIGDANERAVIADYVAGFQSDGTPK